MLYVDRVLYSSVVYPHECAQPPAAVRKCSTGLNVEHQTPLHPSSGQEFTQVRQKLASAYFRLVFLLVSVHG